MGALEGGFIISFALGTDPHTTFKHLLRFPSSCYVQSEDVQREKALPIVLILHFIFLNFGYTLGELTSEGHIDTCYLSRLMLFQFAS